MFAVKLRRDSSWAVRPTNQDGGFATMQRDILFHEYENALIPRKYEGIVTSAMPVGSLMRQFFRNCAVVARLEEDVRVKQASTSQVESGTLVSKL